MTIRCPACAAETGHLFREVCGPYRIFRCLTCGLEFSDPMRAHPDDPSIALIYEGRQACVGQYLGWFHEDFLRAVPAPRGALLDIGCGTGDFVRAACDAGYRAAGIDMDKEAITAGKAYHGDIPLLCMPVAEYFGKDTRTFEVITFFEVLEHLEAPRDFLSTVRSRLTSGGWIGLSVPNNDSPLLGVYRRLTRVIDYPPHHLTRWSKQAITQILKTTGFSVERLVSLEPSFSDVISDACRLRFIHWSVERRLRMGARLSRAFRATDWLARLVFSEGRGMCVLARKV